MKAVKRQTQTGGRPATTGHIPGMYSLAVGMPPYSARNGWRWTLLTNIARLESGHTPSRKHPEYWGGDIPWIGIRDATGNHGRTLQDTEQHTNELGIDNSSARVLPKNTVCLSRTASVGYVVVMGRPMATSQDFVNWVCSDQLDYRFLKYILLYEKRSLLQFASGTTHQTIYFPEVKGFHVCHPDITTQRKIAGVLSAYDDLIENNTRRIAILEEMAQAIYREWFVNFRFPGHEKVKLINSPLGKIPEGWKRPFPDYVDFLEGPGLRRWQYREEGIPFLNIRTIGNNDIDLSKCQFVDPAEVEQKYSHFLLRPLDHIVSSSGTIGRIATVQQNHLPLMLNTSIIRMAPKDEAVGRWQLKHFLQSPYFQNQIVAHASGVAQMNYGPSHLKLMWIIAPDKATGIAYEQHVEAMESLLCSLVKKNTNLRTTRDLLLPKLISGELDVEDLDIETGENAVADASGSDACVVGAELHAYQHCTTQRGDVG